MKTPLLLLASLLLCLPAIGAERPNILIITVDDMSADSVGLWGCELEDTSPNMDALAASGLRFQYAHVQVGNCMPGRNVMWSGKYPHNNGVEGFRQVPDIKYPVLADIMREAGYFTAIRGKVSHSTPYHPYKWDAVLDSHDGKKHHLKDANSYGVSTSDGIAAANAAKKPFCLMINISDPHKPFYAPGRDPHEPTKTFTAKEVPVPGFLFDDPVVRDELALYYSSVRRADDAVGSVLAALKKSGAEENTAVIFLSDHGMPLPFAKTQLYHHSTHTPLVVRWPGVTSPDSIDKTNMVSAIDFLPTILDIAGVKHPGGLEGRSFAGILKGEKQADRDHVVKEYNENSGRSRDPMRAVQTKRHLYIYNPWSNGERVFATATTGTMTYKRMAALAKTNPKMAARLDTYQHRVVEELYDVENDPDCLHNLIDSTELQPELKHLRGVLMDWMEKTNDPTLAIYRDRENAELREAFVAKQEEAVAAERRNQRPKKPKKNAGNNTRKNATNKPK